VFVATYARYRAPAESGEKLVAPPWNELGALVRGAGAWRARADVHFFGQSLAEFAAEARREMTGRAAEYVAAYHAQCESPGDVQSRPLILTGHQPELVHPGVWLKNFAAATLATAHGGLSINLVIDGDACRSTAIRVPAGTIDDPRFGFVPFDGIGDDVPWEERTIVDQGLWRSFADRVRSETASLLPERILDDWWPTAMERARAANGRLGLALAQARHLAEIGWGQNNLELPQSQMCQTAAFRRFACHVLVHLPRFIEAYNGALNEYRRAHHIRNRAQPVPNLADAPPWLQAPFWVWSAENPKRRALYVRSTPGGLVLSDRRTFERPLPARATDADEAVAELGRWEAEGLKLRSRALLTTMFARMAVADLFIHGIGGAKYDEATDAICERFFGAPPPRFAVLSGTLHLPFARQPAMGGDVRGLRQQLRELQFHPERYLTVDGASSPGNAASGWVDQKRRWIETPKTPDNAASRHEAITAANRALQPFVAQRRSRLQKQLVEAAERGRASRVLRSREYAFCLFPRKVLEQFLLDFAG